MASSKADFVPLIGGGDARIGAVIVARPCTINAALMELATASGAVYAPADVWNAMMAARRNPRKSKAKR